MICGLDQTGNVSASEGRHEGMVHDFPCKAVCGTAAGSSASAGEAAGCGSAGASAATGGVGVGAGLVLPASRGAAGDSELGPPGAEVGGLL